MKMPLPGHHHTSSASASQQGAATGLFQVAHTLGSVGAPAGNLRIATSGTTATGSSNIYTPGGNTSGLSAAGGQTAPPTMTGLPGPGMPGTASTSASTPSSASQPFDSRRRAPTFERQPEELHMPSNPAMGQQGSREAGHHQTPQQQQHQSSQDYFSVGPPGISLQQATPQASQNSQPTLGAGLPGALQAGSAGRPGPLSANTAPSTVPTVPQMTTHSQQYTTPARSSTMQYSHTYSRSSPTSQEQQKYLPLSNTPEHTKYASPTNHKYSTSQTPLGMTSYSPLGLADIRPRADSGLSDGPAGANPYSFDGASSTPTNSNYLAPWALYAFDWCKWPVQQYSGNASAGKVAVGSYIEDGHNYVSARLASLPHLIYFSAYDQQFSQQLTLFAADPNS